MKIFRSTHSDADGEDGAPQPSSQRAVAETLPRPASSTSPAPLGFDIPFSRDHLNRLSPATLLHEWRVEDDTSSTRHIEEPGTSGAPRKHKAHRGHEGADDEDFFGSAARPTEPKKSAREWIRDRLSGDNLYLIQAMARDPQLALTTLQQDLVLKIGRYASVGDKLGIRRGVLDLVEKLDVSSPRDAAVLVMRQNAGETLATELSQGLGRLEGAKRTLEVTHGGRVLGTLQPILDQNKAFQWKDGMDRAWGRLTERFAQQAKGTVDVVVGVRDPTSGAAANHAAPAAEGPIGSWTTAAPHAPSEPPPAPVGSWAPPAQNGVPSPEAPIGHWAAPSADASVGKWEAASASPAPSGAPIGHWSSAPPDPSVGKWAAPAGPPEPAGAPIGHWAVPPTDPAVGKWVAPPGPTDPAGAPIGHWAAPPTDPAVGKWVAPPGPTESASAPIGHWGAPATDPAVGKWAMPGGASDSTGAPVGHWAASPEDPTVGKWASAAAPRDAESAPIGHFASPPDAAPGGRPVTTSSRAGAAANGIGQWIAGNDVPLVGGVNLSDVLRQNPEISHVRFVELLTRGASGGPSTLASVGNAARSVLAQRFGIR